METQFHCFRSWRHIVRPTECGEEVVKRIFVCQIDYRKAQTPLVTIPIEQIVLAHRNVKQMSWRDTRWILVVIL